MRNLFWVGLLLLILCGCGGGGGGQSGASSGGSSPSQMTQAPDVTLVRLEMVPSSTTLALGLTTDLQLVAVFSNGIRVDVTGQASFASSGPAVTLSGARASAAAPGSATLTGSFQGQSAQTLIQVTAATLSSLRIDPPQTTLAAGLTQPYRAFGTFSDGTVSELTTSVSWSVAEPDRAEFQASPKGLLRALTSGNTRVVATLQGRAAGADLTVTGALLQSLEISPTPVNLPVGIGQTFTATGVFSDGSHRTVTEDLSWSSSDTATFLISDQAGSKGIGAGIKTGTATVTASLGSVSAQAEVTISQAILQSLTLAPLNSSLAKGLELDFRAAGRFSDGQTRDLSDQVVWSSSDPAVAEVSNLPGTTGRARAIDLGDITISAALNGVSQSTTLTVTAAVLQSIDITSTKPDLPAGLTRLLSATGHLSDGTSADVSDQVAWSSSQEEVAVVDQSGRVTARRSGSTNIRAQKDAVVGSSSLTVSAAVLESLSIEPVDSQLPLGLPRPFRATGQLSDNTTTDLTTQVTWTSGDPTTASISNAAGSQGVARALKLGTTEIRAVFDGLEASTSLEVTAAVLTKVLISPTQLMLPVGLGAPLRATAVFSDGRQTEVTDQVSWSAQGPAVAVDTTGRVVGAQEGSAKVRAELGSVHGNLDVSVQGTVNELKVLTGATGLRRPGKIRFYAVATVSDGSRRDATGDVQWTVQPSTLGTIAQGSQRPGELTAAASGPNTGQVLANLGALQAQRTISIGAGSGLLMPLPRLLSLPLASRRPVRVFSSGLSEMTNVAWTSDNSAVAIVDNGQVVAMGSGNTTLRPKVNGVEAMGVKVHVPSGALVALEVQAPASGVPLGAQGAVSAWALTDHGERVEVTDLAEWSSSAPETLLVTSGRLESRQTGSAQVSAKFQGLSGSATVSVGGSSPSALFVDSSLPAGGDGSQARPFNNLSQAFDQLGGGGQLFAFSGERAGDGMQLLPSLPARLEFRGQKQGWEEHGIAAGAYPEMVALALELRDNSLLQGLAGMGVSNIEFANAANATVDKMNWAANLIRFGTVQGACRVLNSEILSYGTNTGSQAFQIESTTGNFPPAGSIEIGNVSLTHQNSGGNGFLSAMVYGLNGLAPSFRLNVHDCTQQLERAGNFTGRFAGIVVEAGNAQVALTNNTGGTSASITLSVSFAPSRLQIHDNRWDLCDVTLADCGTDVEILRNQISGVTLQDLAFSIPHVDGAKLRVEDNLFGQLRLNTLASEVLVQRNQATSLTLDASVPLGARPVGYDRLFGVRDNQLGTGAATLTLSGGVAKCLALTGNVGGRLDLVGSNDLVVEGLSMLSTLNQFTLINLLNTFVEAPVDSCGIPR